MDDIKEFSGPEPSWRDVIKNIAFIALAIGTAYWITVSVGIDNVRETISAAGIYGPLIIILLKATTIVVVPLGGTPLYPIAGAIFGFWQGLGITLLGDALGSAIAFFISRFFGRKVLHFFMTNQQMPMLENLVVRLSDKGTFLKARLFFTGFPELFAYAAGLVNVNFWFFLVVHVGIHAIPASLLVVFGNILVSGNIVAMIFVGLVSSILAFGGLWWFHSDLTKGN